MKIADHGPDLASLQELVDSVPALIHTARPDGSIDFFNQRWLEYVGLRLEDLEGWKWTAVVHPDDVDALVARWRCLSAGPHVEGRRPLSSTLAGHEKVVIEDALRASGGRVYGPSGAAARLGIARSTLESKIRAHGINKNRFRGRPAKQ